MVACDETRLGPKAADLATEVLQQINPKADDALQSYGVSTSGVKPWRSIAAMVLMSTPDFRPISPEKVQKVHLFGDPDGLLETVDMQPLNPLCILMGVAFQEVYTAVFGVRRVVAKLKSKKTAAAVQALCAAHVEVIGIVASEEVIGVLRWQLRMCRARPTQQ